MTRASTAASSSACRQLASIAVPCATCACRSAENCLLFRAPPPVAPAIARACGAPARALSRPCDIVDASERLARGAVNLIENGVLDDGGIETLAARVGVTSPAICAVFEQMRVAGRSRADAAAAAREAPADRHRAPVSPRSLASGFASVRRFNALFRARYRMAPSRLRRDRAAGALPALLTFDSPTASLDGDARIPRSPRDRWHRERGGGRLRAQRRDLAPRSGSHGARRSAPRAAAPPRCRSPYRRRSRRSFPACCRGSSTPSTSPVIRNRSRWRWGPSPRSIPAARCGTFDASSSPCARSSASRCRCAALGPAGTPRAHLRRPPCPQGTGDITQLFPTAARLAAVPAAELASGHGGARTCNRRAGHGNGRRGSGARPEGDVDATIMRLTSLPLGVGTWTAQYVAMRALRWPDAFLAGDLVVRRALRVRPAQALERARAWQPWRAYAVRCIYGDLRNEYDRLFRLHRFAPRHDAPHGGGSKEDLQAFSLRTRRPCTRGTGLGPDPASPAHFGARRRSSASILPAAAPSRSPPPCVSARWCNAIATVRAGETISYAELARRAPGTPGGFAVGARNQAQSPPPDGSFLSPSSAQTGTLALSRGGSPAERLSRDDAAARAHPLMRPADIRRLRVGGDLGRLVRLHPDAGARAAAADRASRYRRGRADPVSQGDRLRLRRARELAPLPRDARRQLDAAVRALRVRRTPHPRVVLGDHEFDDAAVRRHCCRSRSSRSG